MEKLQFSLFLPMLYFTLIKNCSIIFLVILLIFVAAGIAIIHRLLVLKVISKVVWVALEFLIKTTIVQYPSGLISVSLVLTTVVVVVAVASLAFGVAGAVVTPRGGTILLVISTRCMLFVAPRAVIYLVKSIPILLFSCIFFILLLVTRGVFAVVFTFFPFCRFFLFLRLFLKFHFFE